MTVRIADERSGSMLDRSDLHAWNNRLRPIILCLIVLSPATARSTEPTFADSSPSRIQTKSSGEPLNVRDFGARCDGVTDDQPAIAAALKQAVSRADSIVYFPPSALPCMLSHGLKVPSSVTLMAATGSVTLKVASDNTAAPALLALSDDVTVQGLSFDGGGSEQANTANLIQGFKVSNVTFDHIAVRHSRGIGLLMSSNIVNTAVRDSVFEDLGNHWKTTRAGKDRVQAVVFCCGEGNRGNEVSNSYFSDIGLDALQFSDQSNVKAVANRFDLENGQRGAVPMPNYAAAIFLLRTDHANITSNKVRGAQGSCIDAPGLSNATISKNELVGCGAAGIGIWDSARYGSHAIPAYRVSISGNVIINNGRWASAPHPGGITLAGEATHVSVDDNTVTDTQPARTQKYAIYAMPGSTLTGLRIDPSNRVNGNAVSAFGGLVSAQRPDGKATATHH